MRLQADEEEQTPMTPPQPSSLAGTEIATLIATYQAIRDCSPSTPWRGCREQAADNIDHYDGHPRARDAALVAIFDLLPLLAQERETIDRLKAAYAACSIPIEHWKERAQTAEAQLATETQARHEAEAKAGQAIAQLQATLSRELSAIKDAQSAEDRLLVEREARQAAEKALAESERSHGQTIDERESFHDAADNLAYAIAPLEVIGEHSSMNDPWTNALDALEAERAEHETALTTEREARQQAERERDEHAETIHRISAEHSRLNASLTASEQSRETLRTALEDAVESMEIAEQEYPSTMRESLKIARAALAASQPAGMTTKPDA
jgi:chromosome segregation ATPase